MHQSQEIPEATDIYSYRRYLQQILAVVGVLLFSLGSGSAFALTLNNGSATSCPAGSTQGFLSNSSYSPLRNSFNSSYIDMTSVNAPTSSTVVNIPLKIKMSIADFNVSSSAITNVNTLTSGGYTAIRFSGNTPNNSSVRNEITLDFQNTANSEPLFLNKVALSAFDIDKSSSGTSYWDDNVKFVGTTQSNATVNGVFQSISGSSVINTSGEGLRLDTDFNCGTTLESRCQGSVVFSEPVKSVKMIYTNTDNDTTNNISSRIFDFRLDSYCYQPASYEITKDDGTDSVGTSNITNYLIKVTNNGNTPLTNITLKDPIVTGLSKQNDISCDRTDSTDTCAIAPTRTQLESTGGFNIPSLAVGKTYSIRVPTKVTASQGSTVTNTATIKASNLDLKAASDSNTVTSIFSGGSPVAPASCPSGHKMFYIGNNAPDYTPKEILPIAWVTGSLSKEYVFGNIKFNLSFTDQINLRTGYPTGTNFTDATANAINMYHDSFRAPIDHRLTATINKPVSKYGFVVQDLDANQPGRYIESITLASSGGVFSKTENKPFQLSNGNQTISGTAWDNCNTASPCNFNIDWGYKPASTPFAITHGNPYSEGATTTSAGAYVTGYSDFYFCLAPPKLVVKKALNGNRVNDSADSADQFEIKVTGDSLSANSFTTTGNAATINNGTSDLLSLAESKTYTISERVINGSVSNYSATYICNNATTGSTFTTTNGTATLNAETIPTRSFTLSNLNYGDEITCTITNTPSVYTFTGFVFNDNGGIPSNENTRQDITSTFTGNANYFNGIFDSSGNNKESGIGASGLQVRLTNCGTDGGTDIAGTTAQNIPDTATSGLLLGQYKFTVPGSTIATLSPQKVCVVQVEPSNWVYSVDTTPNTREVTLVANTFDYKTESNNLRNLDFGEVQSNNTSIVLIKSQYVHSCNINSSYNGTSDTPSQTPLFSTADINNIEPGKCIAYRVEAYNRGHVDLNDIQITDTLQITPVKSIFVSPFPLGNPVSINENTSTLPVDKIVSSKFNLAKPTGTSPTKATLYFNTKYGTSQ
ncbi:DUF11 domain-containing protein [Psychrobacter sp. Pi2-51]|uniref:DUF11 domain-containing protein n=1 Tax=Psychrobacter sp. Pi2-51 TaxID=2774132 RepID=UPI00191AEDFB|nr:DUF11 domain-containing protein [Psychrobacter sp. Pi2-51]